MRTRRRPTTKLRAPPRPDEVLVPAGPFTLGTNTQPWAYDNEQPAHVVELPAFRIERHPVTNERFAEFLEDGGYRKRRYWSDDGWEWLQEERAQAPLYWQRGRGGWHRRRFGRWEPVPPAEPVQHISFFEAEAVAAWAGKRLPTEAEWEKAAQSADSDGDANLGRDSFGPLPVARRAASGVGCECMLGDVWEWTSSTFAGYPGFTAFPYAEYSEVFFGDEHRVLRGGSWATDPLVARIDVPELGLPATAAALQRRPAGGRRMSATRNQTAEIAVLFSAEERDTELREEVRLGLTSTPKELQPKWFYDERGSELFDAITRLPEYYLTRAERSILERHAGEIAAMTDAATLIELGSGTSDKTRHPARRASRRDGSYRST